MAALGVRIAVALLLLLAPTVAAQDSVGALLRPLVAGATPPVRRIYEPRGYAPRWLEAGRLLRAGRDAITLLEHAVSHGLNPGDYDVPLLDSLARAPAAGRSAAELAHFDLLLTIALLRYLDDLRSGRSPGGAYEGTSDSAAVPDAAVTVAAAVEGDSVSRLDVAYAPRSAQYAGLRHQLAVYRRLARDTFDLVRAEEAVGVGQSFAQLDALRRRLRATGDYAAPYPETTTVFRPADAEALRRFQVRHGLTPDGVLGRATFEALNVSFAWRVRQIELALERLRWLPPLTGRFVVVNLPAFALFAFDSVAGETPSLISRVIVGKAHDTRTPLLFGRIEAVEFRPYWNVPRSILVGELVPILRRNPGYLRAHDMELVAAGDRPAGDAVTGETLRRLAVGELRVRQRPGPRNALGLVKFSFPNAAGVLLHGTPEAGLFARERRDFSHGCIRVEDATGLATWVLGGEPGWSAETVQRAIQGPDTRRVGLSSPVVVAVLYTTAVAAPDGSIRFYPDVYGLDWALDRALRDPAAEVLSGLRGKPRPGYLSGP